jgi:hypothetical protein
MDPDPGRCRLYSSAGSSKVKIRTSSPYKAQLALYGDEVRILIFDDPAELYRRQRPKFRSAQLDYNYGGVGCRNIVRSLGNLRSAASGRFVPKVGGVPIITFRVIIRLHSKSNRCI